VYRFHLGRPLNSTLHFAEALPHRQTATALDAAISRLGTSSLWLGRTSGSRLPTHATVRRFLPVWPGLRGAGPGIFAEIERQAGEARVAPKTLKTNQLPGNPIVTS
jgi:hypothetical protein